LRGRERGEENERVTTTTKFTAAVQHSVVVIGEGVPNQQKF